MQSVLGASVRIPPIVVSQGFALSFFPLYWVMLIAQLTNAFSRHPSKVQPAGSPILQGVFLGALILAVAAFIAAIITQARGLKSLNDYGVFRGSMRIDTQSLAKKARFIFPGNMPLYVLPGEDYRTLCRHAFAGVAIPRQMLDQLSRAEATSLVARQLAFQSPHVHFPVFAFTTVCNCIAISSAWAGHYNGLATSLLFASLAVAELTALHFALPSLNLRAELYSIQLAGDAEAFFSAQGCLNRFGGAPLSDSIIQKLASKSGIAPDCIVALMRVHPTPPPEDRYPTTGSYLDTGL
jgi:hypothetical protein